MKNELTIGFIGNPNCGKTTLFNAYTGAKLKVANWPGVTVEKKEGAMKYHNHTFKLVDLPGIYSLTSYTMEEVVSRNYILSEEVDVIIDVIDASSLERNLYLTLQLLELGKPIVLALNMMDIVEERGMEIDMHRLPEMLGVPAIGVSARKKRGLDILMHAASHHVEDEKHDALVHQHKNKAVSQHPHKHHEEYAMVYSDLIEDKIDLVSEALKQAYPDLVNYRWHAIKHLEMDPEIQEKYPIDLPQVIDRSYEQDIINEKYDFIEEIIEEVMVGKSQKAALTDKVDAVLTHRFWGLPIFLIIMALVFFLTFTVGDYLKNYMDILLAAISSIVKGTLEGLGVYPMMISLVVDGIITGVGAILLFLPNILILFLALAFLEDSGYMSRVAYVMDGIMGKIGLSGRAAIPMLLGFGCTVPAIMASRALENRRDRIKTILVTPFMSCSARLPIYLLFSELFFGANAIFVAYSLYILGIGVAIIIAFIVNKWDKKQAENVLLIELPEYKAPNLRSIAIYVWDKVKEYLTKAGTIIFVASVILWSISSFGRSGYVTDMGQSFAADIGKILVPIFAPIGLGYWQIVVALISGLAAKEIVVTSCGVLYDVGDMNSEQGMSNMVGILGAAGFGAANAYAMMTFCLLYVPCAATIATIKQETQSTKYTLCAVAFQLGAAWLMAFIVYHIGRLF